MNQLCGYVQDVKLIYCRRITWMPAINCPAKWRAVLEQMKIHNYLIDKKLCNEFVLISVIRGLNCVF